MTEEKKLSFDELLKQISDFEETVHNLSKNVATLKENLLKKFQSAIFDYRK